MKKGCIILFMFLIASFAFAVNYEYTERTWVFSEEGRTITTYNLDNEYYCPKLSTPYGTIGDSDTGTYNGTKNVIGQFGCAFCSDVIRYTVTTTGEFVSQSDPSKTRKFYIAIMPRVRDQDTNTDETYLWNVDTGESVNSSQLAKNTRDGNGEITIAAPSFTLQNRIIPVAENRTIKCNRWWCDLVLFMDDLSVNDYRQLPETDDYVARVEISWNCDNDECTNPEHSGSFSLALRGYFGEGFDNKRKDASIVIVQDSKAMNLDILSIMEESGVTAESHLAQIQVYANTTTTSWDDRLFVFLSASSNYITSDAEGFLLRQVSPVVDKNIPFSVEVHDQFGTHTYDGKDAYDTSDRSNCLTLTDGLPTMHNRQGKEVYHVDYVGEVYIDIPMVESLDPSRYSAGKEDPDYTTALSEYSGIYTSNIYYHVIYDDSSVN